MRNPETLAYVSGARCTASDAHGLGLEPFKVLASMRDERVVSRLYEQLNNGNDSQQAIAVESIRCVVWQQATVALFFTSVKMDSVCRLQRNGLEKPTAPQKDTQSIATWCMVCAGT